MTDLTVIFDMDGVIVDSERVYQEIERDMYREIDAPISREEHLQYMGTAERSMWKSICSKYDINRSVEELVMEERARFIARLEERGSIPLMDGLIPLLDALKSKNIPCWIASSSSSDIISRVIEINELKDYYQGYVSGDDVQESKPSPEIFLRTASLANANPENCVVIEDSKNGVNAAKSSGMKIVGLRHPDAVHIDLSDANIIISSLQELNLSIMTRLIDYMENSE